MSDHNEENRIESWLSEDRPRTIRTRGAVRTRGSVRRAPNIAVHRLVDVSELLSVLRNDAQDLRSSALIDGSLGDFVENICKKLKAENDDKLRFAAVVEDKRETTIAGSKVLELTGKNPFERRILDNLIVDLAILPTEPRDTLLARIDRWLDHSRYLLVEEFDASLESQLRNGPFAGRSGDVFVIAPPTVQ